MQTLLLLLLLLLLRRLVVIGHFGVVLVHCSAAGATEEGPKRAAAQLQGKDRGYSSEGVITVV